MISSQTGQIVIFQQLNFKALVRLRFLCRSSEHQKSFFASSRWSFQNFLSGFICFIGSAKWMRRLSDCTSEVRGQRRFRGVAQVHWPTPTIGSALHTSAQYTIGDPTTLLCFSVLMFRETVGISVRWSSWRTEDPDQLVSRNLHLCLHRNLHQLPHSSYRLCTAAALLLHLPSSLLLLRCFIASSTQLQSSCSFKPYKTMKIRSFTCLVFQMVNSEIWWEWLHCVRRRLFVFLTLSIHQNLKHFSSVSEHGSHFLNWTQSV